MTDADLMQDLSEIVFYDQPDIPVYIKEDDLCEYPDRRAICHWHEDIELILVTEGKMNYQINGRSILLEEQECIVINSRQLHYGYFYRQYGCRFTCIRFHPKILAANSFIYKNYVVPFIENKGIEYLYYSLSDGGSPSRKNINCERGFGENLSGDHPSVQELIGRILALKSGQEDAYELEIIGTLYQLWRILFCQCRPVILQDDMPDQSDLALQKKMVSYIYEHYRENVTLEEIAASASISRSKCCIIFKQYLQQSPIDFMNSYRLEMSRRLLENTDSSVTQIALSCGFNHLSYFSKIFLREFGCTPTEYRREHSTSVRNH